MDLLLEGVRRHYGFDLRNHSRPLLLRRLRRHLREERLDTFSALQERVLHDPEAMEGLLRALACPPDTLFADPAFFLDFRARVVPHAAHLPVRPRVARGLLLGRGHLRAGHPAAWRRGCWGRCRLYASDASEGLLADARNGVLPLPGEEDARNYREAGGKRALSDYYTRDGNWAVLHRSPARGHLLHAAQPGHGRLLQRVPGDPLPQHAAGLQPHAAQPRARAPLREPRALRLPVPGPQGVRWLARPTRRRTRSWKARAACSGGRHEPPGAVWWWVHRATPRPTWRPCCASLPVAACPCPWCWWSTAAPRSCWPARWRAAAPCPWSSRTTRRSSSPAACTWRPPGYHLLVDRGCVCLSLEPPEHGQRPAVDPLFESAADAYGPAAAGAALQRARGWLGRAGRAARARWPCRRHRRGRARGGTWSAWR